MSTPKHQALIVVYSKDYCPYCVAAVNLLKQKGVTYEVVDVQSDMDKYNEMLEKSAPRRTVPQIFIADKGIGGFTELKALEDQGRLDELIFPQG